MPHRHGLRPGERREERGCSRNARVCKWPESAAPAGGREGRLLERSRRSGLWPSRAAHDPKRTSVERPSPVVGSLRTSCRHSQELISQKIPFGYPGRHFEGPSKSRHTCNSHRSIRAISFSRERKAVARQRPGTPVFLIAPRSRELASWHNAEPEKRHARSISKRCLTEFEWRQDR
jgi:hypothetical protein